MDDIYFFKDRAKGNSMTPHRDHGGRVGITLQRLLQAFHIEVL